ncbi:hypothetical protein CDAR_107221 [Caerostris darwini]|uniref:Uncharacterized protein n=1 Tax=Caerostris darwini TaxID=1538125 RepID=A0AAV4SV37_9ARAC|nr:hypothetical protein CDAR_107221 [Caerostris darwini]
MLKHPQMKTISSETDENSETLGNPRTIARPFMVIESQKEPRGHGPKSAHFGPFWIYGRIIIDVGGWMGLPEKWGVSRDRFRSAGPKRPPEVGAISGPFGPGLRNRKLGNFSSNRRMCLDSKMKAKGKRNCA